MVVVIGPGNIRLEHMLLEDMRPVDMLPDDVRPDDVRPEAEPIVLLGLEERSVVRTIFCRTYSIDTLF